MDYLVNLSQVCPDPALTERVRNAGVTIRRVLAPELELVTDWVRRKFQSRWSSETTIAMSRCPPTCFLASMEERMIGFACYDTTARGFFGPTGVDEAERGKGIGHALLLTTLLDMKNMGYGYAIIGDVGPAAFYQHAVGATPISESGPGIYRGMLE
ncbi:GNAT family N-acetyltransferase [Mesorhizobium sp. NPDC059025]|uniref:GNAT family N-acetyltransferase n=1 Tax=unclassified Mesorhizobium TaxID=325217 RepID=UPI0036C09EB9